MSREPLTAQTLWRIPRVGAPAPLPDGRACVVPVTTYDLEEDAGRTRLWWVPFDEGGHEDSREAAPRPLTSAEASSTAPALSPDGRYLAFLRTPGGKADPDGEAAKHAPDGSDARHESARRPGAAPRHPDQAQLHLLPLDGGEAERLTDLPLGVAGMRWLVDGRIVLSAAVYEDARGIDEAAEHRRALEARKANVHVSEDRVVRYWDHWKTDGRVHHLFVLDPETRVLIDLMPGSTRWLPLGDPLGGLDVAPDGRELAFAAARSAPPHTRLLSGVFRLPIPARGEEGPETADPARLVSPDDETSNASRPRYVPDGDGALIYGLRREFDFYADRVRLVWQPGDGGAPITLTEGWDASAQGWTFDPDDPDTLHLLAEVEGRTGLFALDLPSARRAPDAHAPREQLRGGTLGDLAVRRGRAFVTRHALDAPPEVYTVELTDAPDAAGGAAAGGDTTAALVRRTSFTAATLAEVALGAVTEMRFTGHGGDHVQAFLVWPPGVAPPSEDAGQGDGEGKGEEGEEAEHNAPLADPLPLVHMIHGGPHGAFGDGWHWRWSAQAFAAPGNLCALVNFHGSTGFGDAFTRSILGRWGDQPAYDIEAATDTLLARGWIDPELMAITGGSYGGYLVSWLCTRTQRYACAVNHAGVCDFQTQFASDLTQGRPRSFGGELWENLEGLDRWNPLRHAEGLRSPMLVLHGQKDYRVPYAQGLQIYAAYKARALPARLAIYPDENHWILGPNNSLHWYGEVLGWLERWLEPHA